MFIQAATKSQPVKQGPFIVSLCSTQTVLTALSSFLFRSLFVSKEKKKEQGECK